MSLLSKRMLIFAISLDQDQIDDIIETMKAVDDALEPFLKKRLFHSQTISGAGSYNKIASSSKLFAATLSSSIADIEHYKLPPGSIDSPFSRFKSAFKREMFPLVEKAVGYGLITISVAQSSIQRLENIIAGKAAPYSSEQIEKSDVQRRKLMGLP